MQTYATLGERLVGRGLISPDDLNRVLRLQKEQNASLARLVVDLGFISEEDLLPILSDHLGIPYVSLKEFPAAAPLAERLVPAAEFLKLARMVPVKLDGGELLVAIRDPLDLASLHALEVATGLSAKPVIAREKEILERIGVLFNDAGPAEAGAVAPRDLPSAVEEEDVEYLRDLASEVPVIRTVNQMITRALESRASDIHIEPFENELKVRYRIDGILHDVEPPPRQMRAAIVSRFKVLAQLNIAERRLPQDGRFKVRIAGKDVDLRISTVPTLYGESVVVRLLERSQVFTDLDSLGFPPDVLRRFTEMISKPHGMILVTGPTGSGKTTTLYAALEKINDPGKKIITIEDPVEYQLRGINQIQVKPQIGLSFANGLRSIVRQDPDVIMVGEIRDFETAEIAVQAALTGHLVLSTLHTNDAAGAISRLLEMGVQDYLLASSLLGVLAQRLVRRLCLNCRREAPSEGSGAEQLTDLGSSLLPFESSRSQGLRVEEMSGPAPILWEAAGCDTCAYTGYIGRIGIFELLPVTPEICKLIVERADAAPIRRMAISQGMRLLRQDGWEKVRSGVTTLAEVLRVTREER